MKKILVASIFIACVVASLPFVFAQDASSNRLLGREEQALQKYETLILQCIAEPQKGFETFQQEYNQQKESYSATAQPEEVYILTTFDILNYSQEDTQFLMTNIDNYLTAIEQYPQEIKILQEFNKEQEKRYETAAEQQVESAEELFGAPTPAPLESAPVPGETTEEPTATEEGETPPGEEPASEPAEAGETPEGEPAAETAPAETAPRTTTPPTGATGFGTGSQYGTTPYGSQYGSQYGMPYGTQPDMYMGGQTPSTSRYIDIPKVPVPSYSKDYIEGIKNTLIELMKQDLIAINKLVYDVTPIMDLYTSSSDDEIRMQGLVILVEIERNRLGNNEELAQFFLTIAKDENQKNSYRMIALDGLGVLESTETADEMIAMLEDSLDPVLKAKILEVLKNFANNENVITTLTHYCQDDTEPLMVKISAINALSQITRVPFDWSAASTTQEIFDQELNSFLSSVKGKYSIP